MEIPKKVTINWIKKVSAFIFLSVGLLTSSPLQAHYASTSCTMKTATGEEIERIHISAINDSGVSIGSLAEIHGDSYAFMYDGSELKKIDYPGETGEYVTDINSSGQIVGNYSKYVGGETGGPLSQTKTYGFIYYGSKYTRIDFPGSEGTTVSRINDSGIVLGVYQTKTEETEHYRSNTFIYDGSTYTTIDYPEALFTHGKDINNNGFIVGYYYNEEENINKFVHTGQGFMYDIESEVFTRLAYPEATSTRPQSINNVGQIVGFYALKNASNEIRGSNGFIYENDNFTKLDFPNATSTFPYDINDSGKVVGSYRTYSETENMADRKRLDDGGFVYDGSSFLKISHGVNSIYNGNDSRTTSINNKGDIIGTYQGEGHRGSFITQLSLAPNFFTDEDEDGYTIEGDFCGRIDCDDNDPIINSGTRWHYDGDGDGFGAYEKPIKRQCSQPDDYVLDNTDIDDNNPNVSNDPLQARYLWTSCTMTTSTGQDIKNTYASAMNDSGTIIGSLLDISGSMHPFVYDGTDFKTIDYPNETGEVVKDINNSGVIIGIYNKRLGSTSRVKSYGFIFDGSKYTTIDFPGSEGTTVSHINNSGIVLGTYQAKIDEMGSYKTTPFIYDGSKYISIDYPGSFYTYVTNINDSGLVVGYYHADENRSDFNSKGFIYDIASGTFTKLVYPGASNTRPESINNFGKVVGFYTSENDSSFNMSSRGFIYDNNSFREINFPGATSTYLSKINDFGQIVGTYNIYVREGNASYTRFVDYAGFAYDGNTFSKISYGSVYSYTNTRIMDLNNSGEIIGSYQLGDYRGNFKTNIKFAPNFFTDNDRDGFTVEGDFCGSIDCDDNDPIINSGTVWYRDADGDGFGSYGENPKKQCSKPEGYVLNRSDADDTNPNIVDREDAGNKANITDDIAAAPTPTLNEWGIIFTAIAIVGWFYKRGKISELSS